MQGKGLGRWAARHSFSWVAGYHLLPIAVCEPGADDPPLLSAADIISAVEFDHSGQHLATGDRGGRVVLFERVGAQPVRALWNLYRLGPCVRGGVQ